MVFTGHVYADIAVQGVIVDSGASYTTLAKEVPERTVAWLIPRKVDLELGDRLVKAVIYAVILGPCYRFPTALVAGFEGTNTVIGLERWKT